MFNFRLSAQESRDVHLNILYVYTNSKDKTSHQIRIFLLIMIHEHGFDLGKIKYFLEMQICPLYIKSTVAVNLSLYKTKF